MQNSCMKFDLSLKPFCMTNPVMSWHLRMHELRGSKNVTHCSGMSELIFLHTTGKHYLVPKINCHCMIYKCQCYLYPSVTDWEQAVWIFVSLASKKICTREGLECHRTSLITTLTLHSLKRWGLLGKVRVRLHKRLSDTLKTAYRRPMLFSGTSRFPDLAQIITGCLSQSIDCPMIWTYMYMYSAVYTYQNHLIQNALGLVGRITFILSPFSSSPGKIIQFSGLFFRASSFPHIVWTETWRKCSISGHKCSIKLSSLTDSDWWHS